MSSWPSRSSSVHSESVVTPTTATTSTSSSPFSPSNTCLSPLHSLPQATNNATTATLASTGSAVPPLLGLQRLAGNAFSLRQVSVPWSSTSAAAAAGTAGNGGAAGVRQRRASNSPRRPPVRPAAPAAGAVAAKTLEAPAAGLPFITPDTSPRAGWPALRAPRTLSGHASSARANSARQLHEQPTGAAAEDASAPLSRLAALLDRPLQPQQEDSADAAPHSRSLPVSARQQGQQLSSSSVRVPLPRSHQADSSELSGQRSTRATHTPSSVRFAATYSGGAGRSPPLQAASRHSAAGPWSGGGGAFSHSARSCGPSVPTQMAGVDAGASTPLHAPSRQAAWRSVSQPSLSSRRDAGVGAAPFTSSVPFSSQCGDGTPLRLPPSTAFPLIPHNACETQLSLAAQPAPSPAAALAGLFQQYLEAQRTLEPMLRQLNVPPSRYLPLSVQESVLEQVQQFAAQLEAQAQAASASAAVDAAPPHCVSRQTPRGRVTLRKSSDVPWDAILPYLALPPVAAYATLRAVGPDARRRVEQCAWSWLIHEVRACVCPFVIENAAEANVRDAYARLDGRERQYAGGVPVARRTPVAVPSDCRGEGDGRLLDGSVQLDCERQSLLLNRAWREGWLHRGRTAHLHYLAPVLSPHPALRSLRHNPSRIRVDGVLSDVLRPRRTPHGASAMNGSGGGGGGSGPGGAAVAADGALGMEELSANTVPRAGLTPPPPPMLDGRPTAALSVTRKLLGDAVSAISRERARSADAGTGTRLSRRLPPSTGAKATDTTAAAALDSSLLSASQSSVTGTEKTAADTASGAAGGGVASSTAPGQPYREPPPPPHRRHPYFCHDSLPVLVEDVNGTVHMFCTRSTVMESAAVRAVVREWLPHPHPLRRQPLYTSAAEFLLTRQGAAQADGGGDGDDYELCTTMPTIAEWRAEAERAGCGSDGANGAEGGSGGGGGGVPCIIVSQDEDELGCIAMERSDRVRSPRHAAAQRLFHARLQDWRSKRAAVVSRMDAVDPPWRMLGNAAGPQPRPLALHITEQQLPWLAEQLCADSDGGGLPDLQQLHLCAAESLLPGAWVAAWQWCCSVLRHRKNLLVVSVVAAVDPPPMAVGCARPSSSREDGDFPSVAAAGCRDAFTSPLAALYVRSVTHTPSVQVLDLHGITAEAAATFLNCGTSADAQGQAETQLRCEQQQQQQQQLSLDGTSGSSPTRLARLRDLYVTVRRGHGAGASPRAAHLGDVSLSADVFPALQVLWLDAPRLRHFAFDSLLVLRELHLVSDATLLCSALRGIELLPFLEVLHVERAVIDDCAFVGECRALRELLLHACRLSLALMAAAAGEGEAGAGGGVEELRGVERAPRLETLSLCYTEDIRHLRNFVRCRSLRRVLLTRCNGINSESIAGFERLPRLELLALEYTRVSGLTQLAKAPALRVLRVDGCKRVLRSSVMGLEVTPHLAELSLQDTNVTTVANFGGGCTALRSLDLSGCRHLDVDGLQGIQALPQLEVLSLSHTPITDVTFLSDCLRLTTLYVEGCTALQPAALEELVSAPRLQKIIASGCTGLTRVGQLGRCRALEVLSLSGASQLTTEGVQGVEGSPRLQFLDLAATAVRSVRFLAQGCRGLRYLSLRGCAQLTCVRELHGVEELPQLQTLNMENLAIAGPLDFLTLSPSLQYVSYAGCASLTEADVQRLQRSDVNTSIP